MTERRRKSLEKSLKEFNLEWETKRALRLHQNCDTPTLDHLGPPFLTRNHSDPAHSKDDSCTYLQNSPFNKNLVKIRSSSDLEACPNSSAEYIKLRDELLRFEQRLWQALACSKTDLSELCLRRANSDSYEDICDSKGMHLNKANDLSVSMMQYSLVICAICEWLQKFSYTKKY